MANKGIKTVVTIKDDEHKKFHADLKVISARDKWLKELAGVPAYISAVFFGLYYSEVSAVGSFLILLCFLVIYHKIYYFMFSGFKIGTNVKRYVIFLFGHTVFWIVTASVWLKLIAKN